MAGRAQYLPDPVGRPWPGIGRPHVHDIRPNPDRWMSARARCSRPFQEELAIQSVVTALPYDQVKRPPDSYASGLRFRPSCHHSSPDRHRGQQPRGCTPATPPGMWVHTGRFKKLSSAESGKAQLLPDPRRLCQPVVALPARQVAARCCTTCELCGHWPARPAGQCLVSAGVRPCWAHQTKRAGIKPALWNGMVETRRIELPTSALRTPRSPS